MAKLQKDLRKAIAPGPKGSKGQGGGSGGGDGGGKEKGKGNKTGSGESTGTLTQREKRMLRWHMRFTANPGPEYVLIEQHEGASTEGGVLLPEVARTIVLVAKRVGRKVKDSGHVLEGDIVIVRDNASITRVPELKGLCAVIHEGNIAGVIRGYDWREAMKETRVELLS